MRDAIEAILDRVRREDETRLEALIRIGVVAEHELDRVRLPDDDPIVNRIERVREYAVGARKVQIHA